jgi:NAD(P)-dependent dehydrogenase (short-subunit alcohol dehydrogenase family)
MTTGVDGMYALVTGGGSGIGLGTAALLAGDGAIVTICGRTQEKLEDATARIGGGARWTVADITDEDQVAAAVARAADGGPSGGLDILVANAGGSQHLGSFLEADIAAVRSTVELNLIGTAICIKHAARSMATSGGGSIVGMSSGAGHFPHRWLWAYGASKGGVDQLCRNAAEELGPLGIRVNSVQPGIIDDELMAQITAGGPLLEHYLENMPIARVGRVEDVARAVRFLAGPESSWITGVNLAVDGGHHLRHGADYSRLFGTS